MYLLMGLASVMLGLLVQDRQPICGFTRNTTFNVRPIRKDSVRIPASGMKLAVEVYLRKANGAACGCRQPGTPPLKTSPSIHPHAHSNSKGPISVGMRAPLLFAIRNDGLRNVVSDRNRPERFGLRGALCRAGDPRA